VEEIAKKRGWLMSQVALAWIGEKVTCPLVGVSSVSRSVFKREDDESLTGSARRNVSRRQSSLGSSLQKRR
jgi:diketogulonate reductase-like aldo/keto reductase